MNMDRRQFIKIAGLSTLFGLGGKGAFEFLRPGALDAAVHHGEEHAPEKPKEVRKQWAMTIDVEKCAEPGVVEKCIKACHSTHNVPDFGDSKNKVVWLWEDDYEHTFAENENEYMDDHVKELPFLCMCKGVSYQGHIQETRRDRGHGLSPLHRVPLLHGCMSIRLPQLQLAGSQGGSQREGTQYGVSHPGERRGGKM